MTNIKYEEDDYAGNSHSNFDSDEFTPQGVEAENYRKLIEASEARIKSSVEKKLAPVLSLEDLAKIEEIRYLHDVALRHALDNDGAAKSSEGSLSITLGNYWERQEDEQPEAGITLYSYALGPHRSHYFASIDRALETVRVWYSEEMSYSSNPEQEEDFFVGIADDIEIIVVDGSNTSKNDTK